MSATTPPPRPSVDSGDPRAQRTRRKLFEAARQLVSERGTSEIPLSALAEAADVTRQTVYLHFADAGAAVTAAAVALFRDELVRDGAAIEARTLADHFFRHRRFYRAMLGGPSAAAMNRELEAVLQPVNEILVADLIGPDAEGIAPDVALFISGGTEKLVTAWMLSDQPEPAAAFAERLERVARALARTPL